jgi:hypothetical protein
MKGRVEKELALLKDDLNELQQHISPFKVYIQKEVPILENLPEYYRKSDGVIRKRGRSGDREIERKRYEHFNF